ncbi:unnamed protein product [Polarella glacialis]|uniref:Methyltransferase domain-containing protein n=1 Tax=Polarella glacialis TaxID=89957 RepID=A0A813HFM6_POLGL|nr:unnamed protein product [Polarella glacialis]
MNSMHLAVLKCSNFCMLPYPCFFAKLPHGRCAAMTSKHEASMWPGLTLLALPLAGGVLRRLLGEADDQSVMSLIHIYFRYRRTDFTDFMRSHRESLKKGHETGDFVPGVINYYTLMSELITLASGPFWHFVPMFRQMTRMESHHQFHHTLTKYLGAVKEDKVLEIGCGYGEMGRQVAKISGADVTGLTMADAEIVGANARIKAAGLEDRCRMVQGNYHKTNLEAGSFTKVFGIYTLKYSSDLDAVFGEAARLLKSGGSFLSYEILITDKYNPKDALQRSYVENISHSTCMPSLWPAQALRDAAKKAGLVAAVEEDIGTVPNTRPWYSCFTMTGVYYFLACPLLLPLVKLAETLRILPPAFADWFESMLMHPPLDFVRAGRAGIISGTVVMTWKKP